MRRKGPRGKAKINRRRCMLDDRVTALTIIQCLIYAVLPIGGKPSHSGINENPAAGRYRAVSDRTEQGSSLARRCRGLS
ncbi:hypothetical protein BDW71DRAFT_176979 [Aspergillus fruticulosus]